MNEIKHTTYGELKKLLKAVYIITAHEVKSGRQYNDKQSKQRLSIKVKKGSYYVDEGMIDDGYDWKLVKRENNATAFSTLKEAKKRAIDLVKMFDEDDQSDWLAVVWKCYIDMEEEQEEVFSFCCYTDTNKNFEDVSSAYYTKEHIDSDKPDEFYWS